MYSKMLNYEHNKHNEIVRKKSINILVMKAES